MTSLPKARTPALTAPQAGTYGLAPVFILITWHVLSERNFYV
jgi:hypothetical protein